MYYIIKIHRHEVGSQYKIQACNLFISTFKAHASFFLLSTGTVVNMVITINWFVQHFKCKIVRNPKMMNLWMHSSRLIANGHGYCTRSVPYNDIILSKIHQRSSNLAWILKCSRTDAMLCCPYFRIMCMNLKLLWGMDGFVRTISGTIISISQ